MKKILVILAAVLLLSGCTSAPILTRYDRGLWLRGAEVTINNLYPGYVGSMEFEVGNGYKDDTVRLVQISIAPEDDKDLMGYEQLPEQYYSWFTIDKNDFILNPGESQVITVAINVPKGTDYSGKKARCELLVLGWAVVNNTGDVTEVANVPIGLASEWYIETY